MNTVTSPETVKYDETGRRAAELVDAVLTFSDVKRVDVSDLFEAMGEENARFLRHAIWGILGSDLVIRPIYDEPTGRASVFIVPATATQPDSAAITA